MFIVLALPRSRTAWMASFLSYNGRICGHDLVVESNTIMDFTSKLTSIEGTVETAAAMGWRLLRHTFPNAAFAVVRRPVSEVRRSLAKFALEGEQVDQELQTRDDMLQAIARAPGVLSLSYDDLATEEGAKALFIHCLGIRFDRDWWLSLHDTNIQIDMEQMTQRVLARRELIANFAKEVMVASQRISGDASCLGLQ